MLRAAVGRTTALEVWGRTTALEVWGRTTALEVWGRTTRALAVKGTGAVQSTGCLVQRLPG